MYYFNLFYCKKTRFFNISCVVICGKCFWDTKVLFLISYESGCQYCQTLIIDLSHRAGEEFLSLRKGEYRNRKSYITCIFFLMGHTGSNVVFSVSLELCWRDDRVGNRFGSLTANICKFISAPYSAGRISQSLHCDAGGEFWGYYNQGFLKFHKRNVS